MQLLFKNAYVVDFQSPYHLQTVDILVEGFQVLVSLISKCKQSH